MWRKTTECKPHTVVGPEARPRLGTSKHRGTNKRLGTNKHRHTNKCLGTNKHRVFKASNMHTNRVVTIVAHRNNKATLRQRQLLWWHRQHARATDPNGRLRYSAWGTAVSTMPPASSQPSTAERGYQDTVKPASHQASHHRNRATNRRAKPLPHQSEHALRQVDTDNMARRRAETAEPGRNRFNKARREGSGWAATTRPSNDQLKKPVSSNDGRQPATALSSVVAGEQPKH